MGKRIFIFVHYRRVNRNCASKQNLGSIVPRHILRCSTFSLCTKDGSCIYNYVRGYYLISYCYRHSHKFCTKRSTVYGVVLRSKPNFLPNTFLRYPGHTSSL